MSKKADSAGEVDTSKEPAVSEDERLEAGRRLIALLEELDRQDREVFRLAHQDDFLFLNPWSNTVPLAAAPAKYLGSYNVPGAYYPAGPLVDEETLWAIHELGWRMAGPGYGYDAETKTVFNAAIITRDKKIYVALLDLGNHPVPDWVAREEASKNAQ
jgi:hypothetical protein